VNYSYDKRAERPLDEGEFDFFVILVNDQGRQQMQLGPYRDRSKKGALRTLAALTKAQGYRRNIFGGYIDPVDAESMERILAR
jgi:hypothetical protein